MISVNSSEIKSVVQLFEDSIYRNSHLGWFDLPQIVSNYHSVWLDDFEKEKTLIALQPAETGLYWIHSFFCTGAPTRYDLYFRLKKILRENDPSVYAISSHGWFDRLLILNGFKKCDEIIDLETDSIIIPKTSFSEIPLDFSSDSYDAVYKNCGSAFPPLWRLGKDEFSFACETANYRKIIKKGGKIAGYLIAEIAENNCHILRIASAPDFQGQGISSALISQMIRDCSASGITQFSVNTNRNNKTALRFYEALNFKILESSYPVYHRYIHTAGFSGENK